MFFCPFCCPLPLLGQSLAAQPPASAHQPSLHSLRMESEAPPGLAGVADPDAEDDDEVIRELDVFLCNGRVDAQLFLLQFPLRPSWRPYELEDCDEMRFKKQARRLEMELPLCSDSDNYDADVEDPKLLIKKITLQSSEVDMSTSYTVGRIASNALYLTPIDAAFHMRPDMRHLDMANPDVKEKEPKEVEEGLTQLQVL
ncbi:unnamed protein product [Ostreobium quekettii]|uniref:Uncharacterized protein n=1 Tax=Ostreobium quekettii TaxID=121088 RepID=A0A8S1ISR9_9CHLO|nr:unnamed protein product [Ostreobium quekettii]|eukprot:evm.model.scf_818.4 EVM.evm.TU.scf_818.4   scf_818:16792-18878(+)